MTMQIVAAPELTGESGLELGLVRCPGRLQQRIQLNP